MIYLAASSSGVILWELQLFLCCWFFDYHSVNVGGNFSGKLAQELLHACLNLDL